MKILQLSGTYLLRKFKGFLNVADITIINDMCGVRLYVAPPMDYELQSFRSGMTGFFDLATSNYRCAGSAELLCIGS